MGNNWSGYPNGKIPLSMMTQIRSDLGPGGYAQTDAANAFYAMARDFQAETGVPLKFVEAYRDYNTQVGLRQKYLNGTGNVAAVPGTSNHGWGLAFDFAYPMTSWTTQGQAWFRANEARYGFSSTQGVADGEPWHKVYVGSTTTTSGGGATPIEEDDMYNDSDRARDNATASTVGKIYDALFKKDAISGATTGGSDIQGGDLRMWSIWKDATFQIAGQGGATRDGMFEYQRKTTEQLKAIADKLGIELPE